MFLNAVNFFFAIPSCCLCWQLAIRNAQQATRNSARQNTILNVKPRKVNKVETIGFFVSNNLLSLSNQFINSYFDLLLCSTTRSVRPSTKTSVTQVTTSEDFQEATNILLHFPEYAKECSTSYEKQCQTKYDTQVSLYLIDWQNFLENFELNNIDVMMSMRPC